MNKFKLMVKRARRMWCNMTDEQKGSLRFCDLVSYQYKLDKQRVKRTRRRLKRQAQLVRTSDSPLNRPMRDELPVLQPTTKAFVIDATGCFWEGRKGKNKGYRKCKPRMSVNERFTADKRYFEPRQYRIAS